MAARSLERLALESGHTEGNYGVSFVPQPVTGEGAAGPKPPDDSANDVWARISIVQVAEQSDGLAGLTYSLLGRASTLESLVHQLDGDLVDSLVAQSINRSSDPRIGSTLYELLVPHDLKQPLGSGSHLHLLLDESTADLPWELLTPRAEAFRDSRPFALGGGLLRQFLELTRRPPGDGAGPRAAVLVIGNPPPGPGFLPLPGAKREAAIVAKAFGAELDFEDPLGEPGATDGGSAVDGDGPHLGRGRGVHRDADGRTDSGRSYRRGDPRTVERVVACGAHRGPRNARRERQRRQERCRPRLWAPAHRSHDRAAQRGARSCRRQRVPPGRGHPPARRDEPGGGQLRPPADADRRPRRRRRRLGGRGRTSSRLCP